MLAAAVGAAGLYYESTPIMMAATLAALAFVISWIRWTTPHNHWRSFRRRRPWDP
jgi:hypothetical protein